MRTRLLSASLVCLTVLSPLDARAQHEGHPGMATDAKADTTSPHRLHLMAQAIPVLTRAENTAAGRDLTEGYLAQVVGMGSGRLFSGHLAVDVTLNGEGLTMRRGELSTGAFGEGFVDRRHPHTYLHELIASGIGAIGSLKYSGSAGRGFVPYGTDDPMMRPFEKYPINHHLVSSHIRQRLHSVTRLGNLHHMWEWV